MLPSSLVVSGQLKPLAEAETLDMCPEIETVELVIVEELTTNKTNRSRSTMMIPQTCLYDCFMKPSRSLSSPNTRATDKDNLYGSTSIIN
jgi:hypothetical protein